MIGLMDSVMPLFGQRYWRHCVKLMLSVSYQAILALAKPEAEGLRLEGEIWVEEEDKGQMDKGTECRGAS